MPRLPGRRAGRPARAARSARRWAPSLLLIALALTCAEPPPAAAPAVSPPVATSAAAAGPASVLLITTDTLRPDALGWVGGGTWTPNIDRLAREGFRFPAAVSPVPLTLPAHASILSGLVPRRHGVHDNGQQLGTAVPLLAEQLKAHGYTTAAFVSGYPLQGIFGLARGFDRYDDRLTAGDGAWLERPAAETTAAALAFAATARPPWFLWVHYYDPHLPYDPPPGLRQPGWRGAYDGEVAAVDRAVGRLVQGLGSPAGGLLTVFAGDHGESLGEHDEGSHGFFIYDSTVLVPMIWHQPGRLRPGESRAAARLVDVAPTLLDLLGLSALEQVDGVSLVKTLDGGTQEIPAAYLETRQPWSSYGWSPLVAIRQGGWKLIRAPRPELYDLATDAGEQTDLFARERGRAGDLARQLAAAEELPVAAATAGPSDPEVAARLAALGYVGAGRAPEPPAAGLADPKDRSAMRDLLTEADDLMRHGDLRQALERFDRALAEEPDNPFAVSRSGEALLRAGALAEGISRLEHAARLTPDQPEVRGLLAEALMRAGRWQAAATQWMELVRLQPAGAAAWSNLGAALGRAGRLDEAVDAMTRAAELAPGDPDRLSRLAFAEVAAGRVEAATEHLLEAASRAGDPFAHAGALGLLLLRLERRSAAVVWLAASQPGEPEFAEARYALALLRLGSGEREAAEAALAEALSADPRLRTRAAADPRLAPLLAHR